VSGGSVADASIAPSSSPWYSRWALGLKSWLTKPKRWSAERPGSTSGNWMILRR
jgi:hypothetical protein